MHILHLYKTCHTESTGGVEQFIHQLGAGSVKRGAQVDVLCLSKSPEIIKSSGMTIYQAKLNLELYSTGFSLSVFRLFAQLAKKADIIHYHFPWPFMDLMHFVTRINKPTIVTYHSDIVRQQQLLKLYRPLMNAFLNSVDHIVTTSPNYLETSDVLKNFRDKTSSIPIGLDKNSYPVPRTERLEFWSAQFGPKFFLFIGVLRYYKGLHILLEAAKGTHYPIIIVGAGPIEQELKAQAKKLNLRHIHFLGFVSNDDKVALLTLCYAVIFPSHLRSEAFGISLLEGAMYGKPMISSEIGTGTSFINIDNETGLVVPPSDSQALHNAMAYLWDHPNQALEMGLNAEKRYWQYFTAEKMVDYYMGCYTALSHTTQKQTHA